MEKKARAKTELMFTLALVFLFFFSLIPVSKGVDYHIDTTLTAGSDLPPVTDPEQLKLLNPIMPDGEYFYWELYSGNNKIAYVHAPDPAWTGLGGGWLKVNVPDDLKIPVLASTGQYSVRFVWAAGGLFSEKQEYIVWYFPVGASSLWDNLFAPYYLYMPAQKFLGVFDMTSDFCIQIPCPLFILLAIVLFIVFIRFVVPLWLRIPKAARVDPRKMRGDRKI